MNLIDQYSEFCAAQRAKASPVWTIASVAEYIGAGTDRTRAALIAEGATICPTGDTVRLYDDAVQAVCMELPSDAKLAAKDPS